MRTEGTHVWTDDNVQLLLKTTTDFKEKKAHIRIDWDSVKNKYENTGETFALNLPK